MTEAKNYRQDFGRSGEDLAASFFSDKGFLIVDRNWRCRLGEIDLIVRKGDEWRFVEVKTRSSAAFGFPEESFTRRKREHLYRAIEVYAAKQGIAESQIHADVLAIMINDRDFDVRWYPDAE